MLAFDHGFSDAHSADEITLGKANLVLKAAGLNASLITIEQLKFTAPVIFVKIYEAFFEEKIPGINYSPSCRDEHCHNAELIARSLQDRFKYQFLQRVTGAAIIQGDKFSIESIVDLFYDVTQKKITQKSTMFDRTPEEEDEMRRWASMRDANSSSQTIKQYYQNQKRYPNVIPGELKILMERVSFLENKLHGNDEISENVFSKKTKKKKKRRNTSQSDNIMRDDDDNMPYTEHDNDNVSMISAGDSRGGRQEGGPLTSSSRPSTGKRRILEDIKSQRRPTSAPLRGRPSGNKPRSPGRKLKPSSASAARDREIADKLCPEAPTLDELARRLKEKKAAAEEEERKKRQREEEFDKMYTYDTRTGRKMLITEMEQLAAKRLVAEKQQQARDERDGKAPKKDDKEGLDDHDRDRDHPPVPTRPEWPGRRTETSVQEYVEKQAKIRVPQPVDKYPALNHAQQFAAYKFMENLDIVISVEHCCNCSFHSMSLRHKPDEYIAHANSVLRDLAMACHQYHPCARVGVVRFNANITKKSKESDVNSRVGALEVQVAYRSPQGEVTPELIYSKLKTRRWPSKSVIEKRLLLFMSSLNIQIFESDPSDSYDKQQANGNQSYPVGTGSWEETRLSAPNWQYSHPGTDNDKFPLEWVFDSRERASFPAFANGAMVFVEGVENSVGCTEMHRRPGVVARSFKSAQYVDMVAVKLKYSNDEIVVQEDACIAREKHKVSDVFEMTNGLPKPLFTVLKYAAMNDKADWAVLDDHRDKIIQKIGSRGKVVPQIVLCRASFFQRIHSLAWEAIELHGADNCQMLDPYSEEVVDVQLAYSEQILDAVFRNGDGKSTDYINMHEIMIKAQITNPTDQEQEPEIEQEEEQQMEEEEEEEEEKEEEQEEVKDSPRVVITQGKVATEAAVPNTNNTKAEGEGEEEEEEWALEDEHCRSEPQCRQDKLVDAAISDAITSEKNESGHDENDNGNSDKQPARHSTTLSFRERLQQVCLKISPPKEGSTEAGPQGNDIATSKYKAGAVVIFKSLDFDDNEELDIREFQEALVKFQMVCEDHEINKLRAGFDIDGDARITLDEFLKFLHFDSSLSSRDLGDIWCSLRGTDEIDSLSTPPDVLAAMVEMEKDLFSMCTFCNTVGSTVPASVFVEILDKFNMKKDLLDGDLLMLLKVFGVDAFSKKSLGSSSSVDDLSNVLVKYDDFCSWLQPVDVAKVVKRISRFINVLITQDSAMEEGQEVQFTSVDDLIATIDAKKTGFISLDGFQSTIDKLGLPVSRAEVRVLFRHFGTSDGESMSHANVHKMISGTHGGDVTAVIGSRQFRKQSVMGMQASQAAALKGPLALSSENTLNELYDVFEDNPGDDGGGADVFPVTYEPMMVSFSVLEVSGPALEQDHLKKFCIEIKFLLQTLKMQVGREHKQSEGKRHIDVDWDPLELSRSALNNNAAISVRLSVKEPAGGGSKLLGTAYFSPRTLMEFDKNTFFDLPLTMTIDDGSEVSVNIFGRLTECTRQKLANSGSYSVSFADYKFDHDDSEEDHSEPYSDHDHDNMDNDDQDNNDDFLANFSSPTTRSVDIVIVPIEVDPLEESKAGKEVMFDDSKQYALNFKKVVLAGLENVEISGKNDNYFMVNIGTSWSMTSSVKKDSGSDATWTYDNNEHAVTISGKILHDELVSIQVHDENLLRKDVLVAEGAVSITHATYDHDSVVVVVCELKSVYDQPAGVAKLFFEFEECYVADDPSHDDRNILLDFAAATSERHEWKDSMMWSHKTTLDNWLGVDCTHDTALGIHLGANGLNGNFPSNFCALKNLVDVELFGNEMCGSLPEDIGTLQNLKTLILNNNKLTGGIPSSLSKCSKLEEVDLSCNELTGLIPPLSATTTLTTLYLDGNNFQGPLPLSLTNLKRLRSFSCNLCPYEREDVYKVFPFIEAHCDLTGGASGGGGGGGGGGGSADKEYWETREGEEEDLLLIKKHFEDCESSSLLTWEQRAKRSSKSSWQGVAFDNFGHLRSLILCRESLIASQLPDSMDLLLQNVVFLDFSDNEIAGVLPPELFNLSKLQHLFLNNNKLEGPLCPEISQLTNLKTLHLGGNQLTGFLPSELSALEGLHSLVINANKFEGGVPEEVLMLEHLKELDFSYNSLTGPLPDLSDLVALERLVLAGNQFTGSVPESLGKVSKLEHLDISFNPLRGVLPASMSDLQVLRELDIQMTEIEVEGIDLNMRKKLLLKRVASLSKISL